MSSLLIQAVLAAAETGINRVLRLDGTALPRLRRLSAKVIEVDCLSPPLRIFILPAGDGLHFAAQHEAEVDCTLRAPAGNLLHLALARDKTRVLHSPEVSMDGDSAALLELAGILQSLELDWEYDCRAGSARSPPRCSAAACATLRAGARRACTACA